MSTTHNEDLLKLIKTLETYVLNDAQLREVYNKNKNTGFRESLQLIGSRQYKNIENEKKIALLAKIQKANSKYNRTNSTNPNNLTEDDRRLLKKILRHEMYILLKNSPIPNQPNNNFLKNFKPPQKTS